MQEINAWLLSDRDFNKGAELYIQYGTNSFFKSLLKAGPTPYNVKKLGEELEDLAPSTPAINEPCPDNPEPEPVIEHHVIIDDRPKQSATEQAKNHAKYIQLCADRDQVVKQLDRNMAALVFSNQQHILFETAKQILRLHQKKEELWALIDHYNEHQSFEPVEEIPEKSREDKMQLIYQSISKARKRLADPDYKDKARTQKLIDKKLKELERLKGGDA